MNADCGPIDSELLSVEAALNALLHAAKPLTDSEDVPLDAALGRATAAPLIARMDVPPWDYSSMDGYALRHADLSDAPLPVSQRVAAGQSPEPLAAASCARIFTGAPLPDGADTVVIQEVCDERDGRVTLRERPAPGDNIRRAGEDIATGSEVVGAGVRLKPQHLGLAAAVGADTLRVRRRLKVAFLATGDELTEPGGALAPGRIYNVNRYTAAGLLRGLGCELVDQGIVPDAFDATCAALGQAAAAADLILASGGVSVGEEDHIRPALDALGEVSLWRIAVRPGKPLVFGRVGDTPFLGSPGNPVSLFVTFALFVAPFIRTMQGEHTAPPRAVPAIADFDWPKPDRRREYQRARLRYDDKGLSRVEVHPSRSSGVLSSVTWADGLVVIPAGQCIARGDPVEFLPLAELLP